MLSLFLETITTKTKHAGSALWAGLTWCMHHLWGWIAMLTIVGLVYGVGANAMFGNHQFLAGVCYVTAIGAMVIKGIVASKGQEQRGGKIASTLLLGFIATIISVGMIVYVSPKKQPSIAAVPKEPRELLHYYFANEFKGQGIRTSGPQPRTMTLAFQNEPNHTETVKYEAQVVMDFSAQSKFLNIYLPQHPQTIAFCQAFAEGYTGVLNDLSRQVNIQEGGFEERGTELKDLHFTGRIYIWYEGEIMQSDQDWLVSIYKQHNLAPIFRGLTYGYYRWQLDKAQGR